MDNQYKAVIFAHELLISALLTTVSSKMSDPVEFLNELEKDMANHLPNLRAIKEGPQEMHSLTQDRISAIISTAIISHE